MFIEPLFIMGSLLEEWLNYIFTQFYTSVKMITIYIEQVLKDLIIYTFVIAK